MATYNWDLAQWEVADGPLFCEFLLHFSEEPVFSRATLSNDAPGLWLAGSHCLKLLISQVYAKAGEGWKREKGMFLCELTDGFKFRKYRNPV